MAAGLGVVLMRKGTRVHRRVGYFYVVSMLALNVSSFFIFSLTGRFSILASGQDDDPGRVVALLEHTAAAHPLVADNPPPQALVVKLGPDALGLEVHAWTESIDSWMQIRSELAISMGFWIGPSTCSSSDCARPSQNCVR